MTEIKNDFVFFCMGICIFVYENDIGYKDKGEKKSMVILMKCFLIWH